MKPILLYTPDGELVRLRRPAGFRREVEIEIVVHTEIPIDNVMGQMVGHAVWWDREGEQK